MMPLSPVIAMIACSVCYHCYNYITGNSGITGVAYQTNFIAIDMDEKLRFTIKYSEKSASEKLAIQLSL